MADGLDQPNNVRDRIEMFLEKMGSRQAPSNDYQPEFAGGGGRKVRFAIDDLRLVGERYNPDPRKWIAISFGGSDGSDLDALLRDTWLEKGILAEIHNEASDQARERAKTLDRVRGKLLLPLTGDATQLLPQIKERLAGLKLSDANLVLLFLGVLHELPARSPSYRLSEFFGELLEGHDDGLLLYVAEPSIPPTDFGCGWPEIVSLKIGGVQADRLQKFAQLVLHQCWSLPRKDKPEVRPPEPTLLTGNLVRMRKDLAMETLYKCLRADDTVKRFQYELGERLTSFNARDLSRVIYDHSKGRAVIETTAYTSAGFRDDYLGAKVQAYDGDDSKAELNVPDSHVRIIARHIPEGPRARVPKKPGTEFHSLLGQFAIGDVDLDFAVACWVPQGIPENRIRCGRIEQESFQEVPTYLQDHFEQLQRDAEDYVNYRGKFAVVPTDVRDVRFNGSAYSIIRAEWFRDAGDNAQLELRFKKSDFVRRRTTRDLFLLSNGLTSEDRAALIQAIQQPGLAVKEAYSGGFGAAIAIVTADRKLAFFRRSNLVGGDRGAWDCSCVEASALNSDQEKSDGDPPSPYQNARRALWEEAGLRAVDHGIGTQKRDAQGYSRKWLTLHALGCRTDTYEWAMYGVLDLRWVGVEARVQFTEEGIRSRRRDEKALRLQELIELRFGDRQIRASMRVAPDVFEFDLAAFPLFDPEHVVEFICNNFVNDYSVVSACLALMAGSEGESGFTNSEIDEQFEFWHRKNAELQKHLNRLRPNKPELRTDGRMDRNTWSAVAQFWTEILGRDRGDLEGLTEVLRKEILEVTPV